MSSHVDLDRKFASVTAGGQDMDPEFRVQLAALKAETWSQLLEHKYVVVLGEAGAGKTSELRWRADELNETGRTAFFVPIERLATDGLAAAIGPAEMARFAAWQNTQNEAVFLLDSLDEAKLASRTLADAITNVATALGAHLVRMRLIISCRVSDWRAADERTLTDTLRRELGLALDAALVIRVVALVALDLPRIRKLALHFDVQDVDTFLASIEQANAQAFAARPQDVEWLARFWNDHRRLGSLEELIRETVRFKLLEKEDRPSAPSLDEAFSGAKRLAGVSLIAGKRSFSLPDARLDSQRTSSVNPAAILTNWKPEQVRALLTLPLFDEASYGRVRIHHRTVHEYLAAQWLLDLLENGLPRKELNDLLFRKVEGKTLVPAFLAPTVAWLALWDDEVRERATVVCPEHLIDEGDPNGLPEPSRVKILRSYAAKYADRRALFDSFDRAGLGRFGSTSLAEPINELLDSNPPEELRSLLLQLVGEARLSSCVPLALSIALDPNANARSRWMAIRAVGEAGKPAERAAMTTSLLAGTPLPSEIVGALIVASFPDPLGIDGLLTAIEKAEVGDDHDRTSLNYALEFEVPRRCTAQMRETLLERLRSAVFEVCAEGVPVPRYERKWLLRPIADLLLAHLDDPSCRPLSANVIETMESLRRSLEKSGDADLAASGVKKKLTELPEMRRQLFWWRSDHPPASSKKAPQAYFDILGPYELFHITAADEPWLIEDARTKPTARERVLALDTLLWLRPLDKRDATWLSTIEALSRSDLALQKRYERSLRSPPRNAEIQKHERRLNAFDLRRKREKRESLVALRKVLNGIRDGTNLNALVYIYPHGTKNHQVLGAVSPAQLSQEFGDEITSAAIAGLKTFWRSADVQLPYERQEKNAIPWVVIVGLAGVGLDATEGVDLSALPIQTVARAIRLAAWEINFPNWMTRVAASHPELVAKVYRPAIEYEYSAPTAGHGRADFLDKLTRAAPELRQACLPAVLDLLKTQEPGTSDAIESAINCVLVSDATDAELETVLEQRCLTSSGHPDRFAVWWCAWSQRNAVRATEFLTKQLELTTRPVADELMLRIAVQLWSWCQPYSRVQPAIRKDPIALRTLIPIVFAQVRPKEDLQHSGVYSPGPRDEAQHLRDRLLEWLATCEPSAANAALLALAADPTMRDWRDVLLNTAHRVAVSSLTPLPMGEAVDWAVKGFVPISADDLFRVTLDRLDDIRLEDIETGDFSYADLFTKTDEKILEAPVQKWLASRLRDSSRRQYSVTREEEVVNKKKPDIRLHRSSIPGPVSIEVKIADRWTLSELVDSLKVQVVGQYMRAVHSNFAILLLFHVGKRKSWDSAEGKKLSFADAVDVLRSIASTLVDCKQVRQLQVVVFDAAPHDRNEP